MSIGFWDRVYATPDHELPWTRDGLPPEIELWIRRGWLPPGCSVLDLGCGSGAYAVELARRGCDVTGVDLSAVAIEKACRRAAELGVAASFVHADIVGLRRERRFSFVFDYCVFHHLSPSRWHGYREAIERHLKPGGHYAVVSFADGDPSASGARTRVGDFGNIMVHPAVDELESLFEGFEVRHRGVARVGRAQKHVAHHLVFQAPKLFSSARTAKAEACSCRRPIERGQRRPPKMTIGRV
jgi:cyclopropane fatty-acyl-phospholipid synthase-like methyltransferase